MQLVRAVCLSVCPVSGYVQSRTSLPVQDGGGSDPGPGTDVDSCENVIRHLEQISCSANRFDELLSSITVLCVRHRGTYFHSFANKQILELIDMEIDDIHALVIAKC